jgi:hypothetical protein
VETVILDFDGSEFVGLGNDVTFVYGMQGIGASLKAAQMKFFSLAIKLRGSIGMNMVNTTHFLASLTNLPALHSFRILTPALEEPHNFG